ncbi:MAG: hypothetical protein Q7T32_07670 [Moraxellaceae bacterium]|nr:hypothetical protein [Moraxellaceae bacterium]
MSQENISYHQWLKSFARDMFSADAKGNFFLFAIIPATIFLAFIGTVIFPSGVYPRIVLAIPGLIMSGIYVYILGAIVHKLSQTSSFFLCATLCVAWVYAINSVFFG